MHDDEIDIGAELVRALLREQLPHLGGLPLKRVASTGTVNALFRIGDEHVARLPLVAHWSDDIQREWTWLPWLAARIDSVRLPEPVFRGEPGGGYPFVWAVYRWIEGTPYDDDLVHDERTSAETLARFVLDLRSLEAPEGAPTAGRDPLLELDHETRDAIRDSAGVIDTHAAMAAWEMALEAPVWTGERVWIHTDLLPPNILVRDGRIEAVIDFGGAGVGDPASDLTAAWATLGPTGRGVYRAALAADDGTWARGRGIALHQAAMIIPYYAESNPRFVDVARRTIEQILDDAGL